jgi:histidyl-tRNA synthetase
VISLQAEAELLSAIVTFFTRLGITASDVGIKISNRKVSQSCIFFQLSDSCGSSGLNTSSMFFSVKVCKNEASISISEL